jgi:hypothetical protein
VVLLENIRHYLAIWVYAGFTSEQDLVARAIDDWECTWEEDGRPASVFPVQRLTSLRGR